ncbi:N-acetylglucosamine-6-phosphate deacetylase [Pedobacter sp. UYP30]|uniref:N-acetylglucosamine-6-phosphate deacetylase n=1 Tax=Pedobacter sp. UYP30 TaxID=1756400 RepID=UPI00339A0F4F
MQQISNVNFFENDQLVNAKTLFLNNGIISEINGHFPKHVGQIETSKELLVPGFVDLQIYGTAGKLFSAEPTTESLEVIENQLLSEGTTGFLACIPTNTSEVFHKCIETAKAFRPKARNFLGLHLEGPFLNRKRAGAHVQEYIRKATLDEIKQLLNLGDGVIKMMTIAAELQDEEVIKYLLDNGVTVSLGHSDATFEEANAAYKKGVQTTTHLFNAMSPIHHRNPGIPTAVFSHPTAMASIIADGQHVDFEVVKFAKKIMKERLFLITDAVTACNISPYQHIAKGNKYVMPNGTLSGSSLTMLEAVKNCVNYCDIELNEALKMASQYPAKLLGMEHLIGSIATGHQANLISIDEELNLKTVLFKGEAVQV